MTTCRDVDQAGHHEKVVRVRQRFFSIGGRTRHCSIFWARVLRNQYGSGWMAAETAPSWHESREQRVGGDARHPLRPAVSTHLHLLRDCLGHGVQQDVDRWCLFW